jgi:hypothetical protein
MNRDNIYPPRNPKTVARSGARVRPYPPSSGKQPGATHERGYPAKHVGGKPRPKEPTIAKAPLGGGSPSADVTESTQKMAELNAGANSFIRPARRAALRRVAQEAVAKATAGRPGGATGNRAKHPKRSHLKPTDATSGRL